MTIRFSTGSSIGANQMRSRGRKREIFGWPSDRRRKRAECLVFFLAAGNRVDRNPVSCAQTLPAPSLLQPSCVSMLPSCQLFCPVRTTSPTKVMRENGSTKLHFGIKYLIRHQKETRSCRHSWSWTFCLFTSA